MIRAHGQIRLERQNGPKSAQNQHALYLSARPQYDPCGCPIGKIVLLGTGSRFAKKMSDDFA